ncbi:MAG: lytic transglycosylase [bacterium]|nr:MAG: lytic transglycosylase [bacterium]
MRGKHIILATAFVFISFPLLADDAAADIIKFYDEDGTVHFTDKPILRPYVMYIKTPVGKPAAIKLGYGRFRGEIMNASLAYSVDRNLIRSVIKTESDFNPVAVSHAGARGLMQLMPETAAIYSVQNVYDPAENIDAGTRLLSRLLKKYDGNMELALAAYNAGENAVEKYSGVPPYPETMHFVKKAMNLYDRYAGNGSKAEEKTVIYRYVDENGTLFITDTPGKPLKY